MLIKIATGWMTVPTISEQAIARHRNLSLAVIFALALLTAIT